MHITVSKRVMIRIISFAAAVIVALCAWAGQSRYYTALYRQNLQNHYAEALSDLSNYLINIHTTLEKELYVSTPTQLSALSAQLFKEAGSAKNCLSVLPVSNDHSAGMFRFLSQVGNYSLSLSRKASAGQEISDSDRDNLRQLQTYALQLSDKINDMNALLSDSALWKNEIAYVVSGMSDPSLSAIYQATENIAQTVTAYPTLIYDGPFSDHIDRAVPQFTKDKLTISRTEARQIAAKYLNCDTSALSDAGDEDSVTPAFLFTCEDRTIAITKEGGGCLYISSGRTVSEASISAEQAVKTALEYLQQQTGLAFASSYYMISDNICVANFAYQQDGVICYSDLIKVGVALDNGRIENLEARGFIMNHTARELPAPKNSIQDAQAILSPELTVQSGALALINLNSTQEILCYEFTCKGQNDEDILVYVNTDTLQEENILLLLKTDGGTLTK